MLANKLSTSKSSKQSGDLIMTPGEASLWHQLAEITNTMSRFSRRRAQADYEVWRRTRREPEPCDVQQAKYNSVRAAIDAIRREE
jgi:hypothetical protein